MKRKYTHNEWKHHFGRAHAVECGGHLVNLLPIPLKYAIERKWQWQVHKFTKKKKKKKKNENLNNSRTIKCVQVCDRM